MSNKIPVSIIITTYDPGNNSRFGLLYQTVQALVDKLKYPNLYWIVTDDGSPQHDEMVEKVRQIIKNDERVTFFNTMRKGVGYAKNNALQHAFNISPYVFLLEDDWLLKEELDLLPLVQVMLDYPDIGILRLGYLGGEMLAKYTDYGDFRTYWTLVQGSGVYVYSGQISLRSKLWYEKIGWHKENCSPGEEELDMCLRANGAENCPKILWPSKYGTILNEGPFLNIGLASSVNGVIPNNG